MLPRRLRHGPLQLRSLLVNDVLFTAFTHGLIGCWVFLIRTIPDIFAASSCTHWVLPMCAWRSGDIEWSQLFTLNVSSTRGHGLKLFKNQSRTTLRQKFSRNVLLMFGTLSPIMQCQHPILLFSNINQTIIGNRQDMYSNKGLVLKLIFVLCVCIHYQ